jgi:DNA-directed RNA polymerase specialized sigma24 family protein
VTADPLWPLFRALAAGDDAAWPALMKQLEPDLVAMARRQPIGRLRDREDSPREIVTRVFARLHARNHAAIRKLCALDPPPELRAWLRVLVRRSAIDYMRDSPEFERATAARPDRWISLASLSSGAPAPDPDSLAEKRELALSSIRDMVQRAAAEFRARGDEAFTRLALEWRIPRIHIRRLVTRGPQLLAILIAVLEGHAHTEIAARLGITRREVELGVRYVEELLHARFVGG